MSNLGSIQKALESVERKKKEVNTLRHLVRNVESQGNERALFSGDVNVWDGIGNQKVQLSQTILEMLLSKKAVINSANACIEKLEAELADLNVLLGAFSKVMEPILKEQEQC
jgi:prefoldin subunit 5